AAERGTRFSSGFQAFRRCARCASASAATASKGIGATMRGPRERKISMAASLRTAAFVLAACLTCAPTLAPAAPRAAATPPRSTAEPTVAELIARLRQRAAVSQRSPAVRADYLALLRAQNLDERQAPYADFAWLRLLFEATRDGGYWNLRW